MMVVMVVEVVVVRTTMTMMIVMDGLSCVYFMQFSTVSSFKSQLFRCTVLWHCHTFSANVELMVTGCH